MCAHYGSLESFSRRQLGFMLCHTVPQVLVITGPAFSKANECVNQCVCLSNVTISEGRREGKKRCVSQEVFFDWFWQLMRTEVKTVCVLGAALQLQCCVSIGHVFPALLPGYLPFACRSLTLLQVHQTHSVPTLRTDRWRFAFGMTLNGTQIFAMI